MYFNNPMIMGHLHSCTAASSRTDFPLKRPPPAPGKAWKFPLAPALPRSSVICIYLYLHSLAEPKRRSKEEATEITAGTATSVKPPPLVPVKTFYLPLTAIQGAPYFPVDK